MIFLVRSRGLSIVSQRSLAVVSERFHKLDLSFCLLADFANSGRTPLITRLERLLEEVRELNSRLILVVSGASGGKTELLRALGARMKIEPLNAGVELGRRLSATPIDKRSFCAGELLREIALARVDDLLLVDNIELLFEKRLQVNPLDLLKRLGHSKRVVAVWPGVLRDRRLIYADRHHPEHRDSTCEGVVVLEI